MGVYMFTCVRMHRCVGVWSPEGDAAVQSLSTLFSEAESHELADSASPSSLSRLLQCSGIKVGPLRSCQAFDVGACI